MATQKFRVYKLGGLNVHTSPFLHQSGELISCLNVDANPHGAKEAREGYSEFLPKLNEDGTVTDLFSWYRNDGTTFYLYAIRQTYTTYTMYSCYQGTGAWTSCGDVGGPKIGHAVLGDKLFIGDGVNPVKYSSNGTSFGTMALAPTGQYLAEYQKRIYVAGTVSTLFYSTTLDGTNWNTSGTSDSSSFDLGGGGRLGNIFVANDRLNITKNNNTLYRWDGYSLLKVPTKEGPVSPNSLAEIENYWIWQNRHGYHAYYGAMPELISLPMEPKIVTSGSNGIGGSVFSDAPAVSHNYEYYCSVGTVTDDISGETISNCIQKYNYLHNEWSDYSFKDKPFCWLSYVDLDGNQQLLFGSFNETTTRIFKMGGTSDNGNQIVSEIQGVLNFGVPDMDKKFSFMRAHFNPGCGAKMQVAITDTFNAGSKKWIDLGDLQTGFKLFKFPEGSRGKLLFYKVTNSSINDPFRFYGMCIDWEEQGF